MRLCIKRHDSVILIFQKKVEFSSFISFAVEMKANFIGLGKKLGKVVLGISVEKTQLSKAIQFMPKKDNTGRKILFWWV